VGCVKGILCGLLLLLSPAAWAGDELASGKMADGTSVPYVLTTGGGTPAYALILMPGGVGVLSPHLHNDGSVAFQNGDNFAVRVRGIFAEGPFVAATTDRTSTPDRILAIVADLQRRYPGVKIYVMGFSLSTESTMALAKPLDGKVAGFVHSSSMNGVASLDPRSLKSRHLIVVHKEDVCPRTNPSNGMASNRRYGTPLIVMEGGRSVGVECGPVAHHGYYGIERETVDKIKQWIIAGG
jgi:hypothetical protein